MNATNPQDQVVSLFTEDKPMNNVKANPVSSVTLDDIDCGLLLGYHDLFCEFYYTKAFSEPVEHGDRVEHVNTPANVDIIKVCFGDKDGSIITGDIYDTERLKSKIIDAYEEGHSEDDSKIDGPPVAGGLLEWMDKYKPDHL